MKLKSDKKKDLKSFKKLMVKLDEEIIPETLDKIENFVLDVSTSKDISRHIKENGIPEVYLSQLAQRTNKNYLRELMVREMLANTIKGLIKGSFAFLRKSSHKTTDYNLKQCLCYHFNRIFDTITQKHDSDAEWNNICDIVNARFQCSVDTNVQEKVYSKGLVLRLLDLLGVKLNVGFDKIDLEETQPFRLHFFDIEQPKIVESFNQDFITIGFLNKKAKEFYDLGKLDTWWIESGVDMDLAIFFFTQTTHFVKLVSFLIF